jgi:peptidoglycan LD-endopeptidase LytH
MNLKYIFFLPLAIIIGCNGLKTIKNNLANIPPYDQYVQKLEKADLHERPMVKKWVEAGRRAMKDSIHVTMPFVETGYFVSHQPDARSYQFEARDGQVITVNGALKVTTGAKVFVDLFIWSENEWKNIASSDSSLTMSHEFTRDAKCLLRIQPELLVNAFYSLSLALTPILINPVSGADNNSIQSFYGDSRDGGKRSHEGIDIFAKKGTQIVAPTRGTISRVGTSKLGGKVVWMYDQKRGHSYYFAHLDTQYVHAGQLVNQGDVIGTVGNTGNARYTPAHLHFGIYQSGSKDPINYVKTLERIADLLPVDTTFRGTAFKTVSKKSELRRGPGVAFDVTDQLAKETFVHVVGQSRDYFRVVLPDKRQGFILRKEVMKVDKGTRGTIRSATEVYADLLPEKTSIKFLAPDTPFEALAQYKQYTLIRTEDGVEGWIQ